MTDPLFPETIEAERYELADAGRAFAPTRRELLTLLGAGLTVLLVGRGADAQESGGGRRGGGQVPQEVEAWLHVAADGSVAAFTGKTEVGQNIRTSLSQAVAEELRVPLASVRLVMADTELVPYDMGTFGSRTTPTMAPQLRRAAAAAREALLDLAAEQWKVPRESLTAENGKIAHGASGKSAGYGELTKGQSITRKIETQAETLAAAQWSVQGKSAPKIDGRAFVTGAHKYTSDIVLPGMVHGAVLRPPRAGATLSSLDTPAGASVIRDGDFAGVVAPTRRAARQALAGLKPKWTPPAGQAVSSTGLFAHLRATAEGERPALIPGVTDAPGGGKRIAGSYEIAYIAHVPLEPRAAVAQWSDGKLTVWTGTQRPFGVREELSRALNLPPERVRVIVPDTGSGYGGKHTGEAAIEAARLARACGKPVKLVWTREEEFAHAYFRPGGVIEIDAAVGSDGKLSAWEMHNLNSGGSALETPYEVASPVTRFHNAASPLRQGSYRGLAATANNFARELHMDRLAAAVKLDPLELRRRNLGNARLRAVLDAAAGAFRWTERKKAPGRGFGLACGTEKGGYVATCVELEADPAGKSVRLVRATTAFECGAIVNPEQLRNQVEGAVVQGLGGALWERIAFDAGQVTTTSLSRYRVPRFKDTPVLETVLVDRKDLPSAGAGECPIIAIAPAIGSALFDATGAWPTGLPMTPVG